MDAGILSRRSPSLSSFSGRSPSLRRASPAAALAGVCAVAALTPMADDEGQVLCPYRMATGGWCPGCGCTRALRSLVRIDPSAAFQLNPWILILFAQAVAITSWIAIAPERALAWWSRYDTRVFSSNLTVGVAIWVARMGTGAIPTPTIPF